MKKFGTEVHLSREMKLLDVTMIGVGAMIGAGIFVLTGIAAGVAGPALIMPLHSTAPWPCSRQCPMRNWGPATTMPGADTSG